MTTVKPTRKKTTTFEPRDWPYSIRAGEVSRCLVEHGGLPKPQRVCWYSDL